jgi:Tol biopolymer transport system component
MVLSPGDRVGSYEVVAAIGAGGMGEVYRARDSKLNRDVAIKILPEAFLNDPDRLARFKREAQVLAAVNHPNVGAIYGFDDGAHALILEFVDGPTVADRIAEGAVPLDEALRIARQIAEALEAAHDQGIVHRDLKPANIKLRPDGIIKVLDFGLAKAFEPPGGTSAIATLSPTITSPAMTQIGVILGTAAYMSPEQAKGRPADKRSDVWGFGCVVYEMLSGKRPFEGDDISDTLAAVLRAEPDWTALPASTPAHIRTLLRRCLQKDPRKRLPHIGVARLEIDEGDAAAAAGAAGGDRPSRVIWLGAGAAILATLVAVVTAIVVRQATSGTTSATRGVQRLSIGLPATAAFTPNGLEAGSNSLAISPDGSRIAYVATAADGKRSLYLRDLDQLDPRSLPGTDHAAEPTFSPDGEEVAFFVVELRGALPPNFSMKKVAVRGGAPVTLAASLPGVPGGAAWTADDRIVFSVGTARGGPISPMSLFVIPSLGGTPRPLREASVKSNGAEAAPHMLPDGRHILVSIRTGPVYSEAHIDVMSVDGRSVRTVIENGYHGRYVASGHIVYMSATSLMAVPFDVARLETTGPPTLIAENVGRTSSRGDAPFDVSRTGVLVHGSISVAAAPRRTMTWVDRRGREEAVPAPVRAYMYPRISPDGTRVAIDARDESLDIWTWDLMRRILSRVTTDPAQDAYPVWSPDGRRLAFASPRGGLGAGFNMYWQNADGTGTPERLTDAPSSIQAPFSITPDGKQLIFRDQNQTGDTGDDMMMLSLDERPLTPKQRTLVPLVRTSFNEGNGEISPDGRWLAYQSNESGQNEVYVRPFPNTNTGRWTVSSGGGTRPVWARNGRELFYVVGATPNPVRMMRVAIESASTFAARAPQLLFEGRYFVDPGIAGRGRTFDISPDGQRFLMIKDAERIEPRATPQPLIVILNWQELFKPRGTTK